MDVREKLVEMIDSARYWGCGTSEEIAQNLIANGATVLELGGCEYCNGLPFSQIEDLTMQNASKKDYDIVTIRFCPMCGRRLPQQPK